MATIVVLSIILTMAVQVTESARVAIRLTESQSSSDAIARQTFERISRDLAQMVVREDARIEFKSKAGNDEFAFLTRAKGFTAAGAEGQRDVSLVSYSLLHDATAGEKLLRESCGHLFGEAAGDALKLYARLPFPAISPANLQTLINHVIRLEIEYLLEGTLRTYSYKTSGLAPLVPPEKFACEFVAWRKYAAEMNRAPVDP